MLYLAIKAVLSGLIIAAASEVSRRWPGWGAPIVSLPLVSVLAMVWLWRDTHDPARIANEFQAIFWFFLPTMPMFLLIPYLLRHGVSFWGSLAAGCALTVALYLAMIGIGPRLGLKL